MAGILAKLKDYRRVVMVARKPSKDEFLTSAKITSLGLLVIGAIGFVIFLAFVIIGLT